MELIEIAAGTPIYQAIYSASVVQGFPALTFYVAAVLALIAWAMTYLVKQKDLIYRSESEAMTASKSVDFTQVAPEKVEIGEITKPLTVSIDKNKDVWSGSPEKQSLLT